MLCPDIGNVEWSFDFQDNVSACCDLVSNVMVPASDVTSATGVAFATGHRD